MNGFIFHTPTQWAVLILLFVAGWLFGLASHPGGKRWKRRYHELEERSRERDRLLETRERELAEVRAERDRLIEERRRWAPADAPGVTTRDDLSVIRGIDPETARKLNDEGYSHYSDVAAMSDADGERLEDRFGLSRGRIASEDWRTQADLLREGRTEEHARRFS